MLECLWYQTGQPNFYPRTLASFVRIYNNELISLNEDPFGLLNSAFLDFFDMTEEELFGPKKELEAFILNLVPASKPK